MQQHLIVTVLIKDLLVGNEVGTVPRIAAGISSRSRSRSRSRSSRSRRYFMKTFIFKICQKKNHKVKKNWKKKNKNILKLESKKMGLFQMYEKS
jgi:hypothetical protein